MLATEPDPPTPLLEVSSIDVFYQEHQALWEVSLRAAPREIVCLLGVNGSGKSTCLKAISGLLNVRRGSIKFDGERIDKRPTHRIVDMGIVQIPERRRLFPHMTVEENLLVGAVPRRAKTAMTDTLPYVYDLLPRVRERRKQRADTLSGGEQQMVAIGRGLMGAPRLLMVDEPFLGLTPRLSSEISAALSNLRSQRGITILFNEQDLAAALSLSDTAYVLDRGRVVWSGPADKLIDDEETARSYFGFTRPPRSHS